MTELVFSASFLAAFFAGVAALFAPCCITVLLPTYLASVFKQKATVFLMTFIYFLGLLVVFLPLGLGATILAQFFSQYHNILFIAGAIFLILLGLMQILGKHFTLPFTVSPKLQNTGSGSVFALGVFSGVATACCAPVLAGVLALSILPGSWIMGALYTLTYVLGMVVPLFTIAIFLDKVNFTQKFFTFRKIVSYRFLGEKVSVSLSGLLAGLMFLVLGVVILFFASSNQLTAHSSYQLMVNLYVAQLVGKVEGLIGFVPQIAWAFFFMVLFLILAKTALNQLNLNKRKKKGGEDNEV
ncbi:MAG: cytochrome c biogenesis protein CcdA [bacterium]|nr:cytochrome c biogenesis protein CcdA [bacterium]